MACSWGRFWWNWRFLFNRQVFKFAPLMEGRNPPAVLVLYVLDVFACLFSSSSTPPPPFFVACLLTIIIWLFFYKDVLHVLWILLSPNHWMVGCNKFQSMVRMTFECWSVTSRWCWRQKVLTLLKHSLNLATSNRTYMQGEVVLAAAPTPVII